MVNLRDAFTSKDSAIADEMTGKVETKLLDKKVAAVEEQVAKIARTELNGALPPQLARISKTTALARTSMTGTNLGRTSATAIQQQVQEIEVRRRRRWRWVGGAGRRAAGLSWRWWVAARNVCVCVL